LDLLFALLVVLIVLAVVGIVVTVVGHGLWLAFASVFRSFSGESSPQTEVKGPASVQCQNCNFELSGHATFCGRCGWKKLSAIVTKLLEDLSATERQLERFHRTGKLDERSYTELKAHIEADRRRLTSRDGAATPSAPPAYQPPVPAQPASVTAPVEETAPPLREPSVVTASFVATDDEIVIEPTPTFLPASDYAGARTEDARQTRPQTPPRPPRRSFPEMLNSFMEESNIRWGEIVGGLLIIGCSTALVVSLWSQISQIPVVKFLIFTTVTAALFGIGLYTEHRWKLPTTSRGILTIATLLVPLNFLAIAAVSAGPESPGALILGSELIAPAVFLGLVYFAGRVLTPSWPHLLVAGVLGSSIGQLLIRHFASPDLSPGLLVALGAFPVICYVTCAIWMLKKALADREIDEAETIAIFITLGALTFAALLPFGLLLYKSGPVGMTMMYLAPLVSLGGSPLLAIGTLLWQRIKRRELVASRTAGTSLAILGAAMVLAGMILAWPNPASIVPAALFNFAVFTTLAVVLEIPGAHLVASFCFGLAYLVLFHVMAGHVAWQNLRVTSLLNQSLSVSSGQALAPLFVLFVGASEWLTRKRNKSESKFYLVAACAVALVSLALATWYGRWTLPAVNSLWIIYGIYALGAFWIASRLKEIAFTWIGSALLLAALAQAFARSFEIPFPWQAAFLAHATLCAAGAILAWRYENDLKGMFTRTLSHSALVTSFAAVISLLQTREWQTTGLQAERVFWLATIWLGLLWVVRQRVLFTSFQIALTAALVLAVKGLLQQYEWYAYLPHAFLHPWGLQIQGTVLLLLSLVWVAARFAIKSTKSGRLKFLESLLDSSWAIDRLVMWVVLVGFVLLAIYGAFPGVTRELTAQGTANPAWDIAGFPHQEALGIGSWILLGLLVCALLATAWERRRTVYALGAVVALSAIPPLLAGRFETDIATASAWRWLGALFLLVASLPILFRDRVFAWIRSFGWPAADISETELAHRLRLLLLAATLGPIVILTTYPALRAIYYMPVHGPASGVFSLLKDSVSYGVPLVIVALVMIALAVRERLPDYAFGAGLVFNVTAKIAYLLSVVAVNGSMDRVVLAQAIQTNAIVFGLYALVWLSLSRRWLPRLSESRAREAKRLLTIQVLLAFGANALLIGAVALKLIAGPEYAGAGTFEAGSVRGRAAFIIATLSAGAFALVYKKKVPAWSVFVGLLGFVCLVAFGSASPSANMWTASHVLLIGCAVTAWTMLVASWFPIWLGKNYEPGVSRWAWLRLAENWGEKCLFFAACGNVLTVVLGLRRFGDDPSSNWWTIAPLLAMTALFAALNWVTLKRKYLYFAGVTFSVAAFVWAIKYLWGQEVRFLEIHVIASTLPAVSWLALELRARRLSQRQRSNALSFHNVVALWALLLVTAIVSIRLALRTYGLEFSGPSGIDWLALGSLTTLLLACVWDRSAKYAVAVLYFVGLLATAMFLDQLSLSLRRLAWSGTMTMAIYAIGASVLWRSRAKIIQFTDRLKMPRRIDPATTELKWLSTFNTILVAIGVTLGYWIVLVFPNTTSRLLAALAVAGQALTFALLAEGVWRARWRRAAIAAFVTGLVFVGWAWLVPGTTGTWLNRAVILMLEMFALVSFYALVLNKALRQEPEWTEAARRCVPWIAGTGAVALLFALSTEVFYQINFGAVRINKLSLIAIGVTLVAGIVICVLFALSEKHEPLKLPERGRMNYVYAGEAMLALLFMHIRLTMPWLFTGFFEQYWPFVVMAIAYLGVATSEALRRRQILVLAQPIERTGVFLPLLPVIGFWIVQSKVDYSALLFVVGGIYGLLSILRRSFVFGILAAIAGNGGLWYLLHRTDSYQFLQHPQLWLIPIGLSVLLAAYLNEDDFTEDQMAGIRYMSLVMIYASSTADIFINGVADSPWLPLALAALSLAGVFSGIIFRIRGLLLLGCVFLLIAVITMIWYASVNLGWTWLWYVAGIATGATIIFMFAVFEKKRAEVLRVVEGFKDWDR